MAYARGDEAPKLWLPHEPLPDFVSYIQRQPELHTWNSFFEYCIWTNVLKWPATPISQWHDTAAKAAALALPRKLSDCGSAISLPQDKQKNKRGSYLIQRLCKPNRGKRIRDPELLQELYSYCKQDVVAEREIDKRLRDLSKKERCIWELDQKINIRGFHVDSESVDNALNIIEQVTEKLNGEIEEMTDGALKNTTQRQKILDYVTDELGFPLEKFDKNYLAEVIKDKNIPPLAKRIIQIRQSLGKTSTAKYKTLKLLITHDSRVHGSLRYHGASTGRWSGALFQPHNLPRPSIKNTDQCISLFKDEDPEFLDLLYGDCMEVLSSCIRGMISAPKGKKLMVADFSAIEARVLAWLAGQEDILKVFKGHGMIYEHTASQIFNKPINEINTDERFIGKTATLALGYQGGVGAFMTMAEQFPEKMKKANITETLAEEIKERWREANCNIVQYWYTIEAAAKKAVQKPGSTFSIKNIKFCFTEGFLFCRLPSSRLIAYYDPIIEIGTFGKLQVSFMGTNSVTRKWERQFTYGGKLVENITQAVARDLMAEGMLHVEQAGYQVVLSVHDELLAECDEDFGSIEEFSNLMCKLPSWAKGLPLTADGFECKRYRKR